MEVRILDALRKARAAKRPVALATNLRSGQQKLIFETESEGPLCLDVDMLAGAAEMLKRDESGVLQTGAGPVFIHSYNPPPRLVVVGAVHIAEPLASMATLAGYATLTHDPKIDDPSLRLALQAGVGYVGALGSRRTQEQRNARLRESGCTEEQVARIHGPVGLDIGAHTPAETAVAILAEVIAYRSGRSGQPLRATTGRIHPTDEPGA